MWCISASMSEGLPADPLGSLIEAWDWLAPERAVRREGLGERLWPELGPGGRARARELLDGTRQALDALPALPAEQVEHGRRLALARWLEREDRQLREAPHPARLAEVVEQGLGLLPAQPDVELDPALRDERLATLADLLDPLRHKGCLLKDAAGRDGDGPRAARRMRVLARRLEARGMVGSASGLESLGKLAAELEAWRPGSFPGPPEESEAWRELESSATWSLTDLLERVERERELALAEAGRRAATLRQRWLGEPDAENALPWLREQLAQDPPRPEQLAWLLQRHLGDLVRHLGRLGLEAAAPPVRVLPGRDPGWPLGSAPAHVHLLALPDLSLLSPGDLEAQLGEWHHGLLPLLAAREGVPGRLWLLGRLRAAAASSEGVAAWTTRLVRPEDLDAWAAWAGAWLPRTGWLAGDPRLRLLARDLEARELVLARADLELRLATRPPEEVRRRLEREAALPPHLAQAALAELLRHPGRQALAAARRFELVDAARRWRRLRKATDADVFHLLADCAWLPLDWLRAQLGSRPAPGLRWAELPPAVVRPASRHELLGEVEERLAALGRIRREDLEAGREFDALPAMAQTAVDGSLQDEDSATVADAATDGEHGAATE
jgi:hypothetical protein